MNLNSINNLAEAQEITFRNPNFKNKSWFSSALERIRKSSLVRELELFYITFLKERVLYGRAQRDFYKIFGGHILFQVLAAAAHLDLFNLIQKRGSMTASEIAKALEIDEQPCRIMLLSLVSSNILKKKDDEYFNTALSKKFLTSNGEWKFLNCLRWQHCINYRPMFHFEQSLLANRNVGLEEIPGDEPTLYQRLSHQPILEKVFQDAMQEISKQCNHFLARYVDFSKTKYLIDVGGGDGTNIITIAKEFPNLKASIFDFPTICDRARDNIRNHGLDNRLGAIPGNVLKDPLPTGADCIIFCHFFTIWSIKQNLELLKKACTALPKGGRVIVFNMMQNDNRDGPMTAAVGSPYFLALATGQGMLYSWNDYEDIFEQAGFSETRRMKLPRDHGVIIGIK